MNDKTKDWIGGVITGIVVTLGLIIILDMVI